METFSALLAICAGNSPVSGEFPAQRPVTRSFYVFFDLRPNKGWVNNYEAGDLRRICPHYDVTVMKMQKIRKTSVSYDPNPTTKPRMAAKWILPDDDARKLTHWGTDKMAAISQTHSQSHFREWKF